MNQDLVALLVVQQDDDVIRAIEARGQALAPRLSALDKARQRAIDEVAHNEAALARETERHRALESRLAEHRARHEKNLGVLNQAHKLKEATAAMAQVETARKVLADDESELLATTRRLGDLRSALGASRESLEALGLEQAETRSSIEAERAAIASDLARARAKRMTSAEAVSKGLLFKYDRVQQRRRAPAVFALHPDFSCGSCDTAIPLQRRPAMTTGHAIEVCEACGVLLYLAPSQPPAGTP